MLALNFQIGCGIYPPVRLQSRKVKLQQTGAHSPPHGPEKKGGSKNPECVCVVCFRQP